jgi:tetratricopeptide (TPR) repeat protein
MLVPTSRAKRAFLALVLASGVGGCKFSTDVVPTPSPRFRGEEAEILFRGVLTHVAELDRAHAWNQEACAKVENEFASLSRAPTLATVALYDEGVVRQRCGDLDGARANYRAALDVDPNFHRARTEVALIDLALSKGKNLDAAIGELGRAIKDSGFQNTSALVNLAHLQMARGGTTSDADGKDDFERAKKNLQRALAVDDASMPAYAELARYYYEMAKRHSNGKNPNREELDLAQVVTSQASRRDPSYAPIHNVAGLVAYALGDLPLAATEFGEARRLDPSFFEAHMNYAALNLEFRGFEQAEAAYRQAIHLEPDDYDAHLGLSLALRGEIAGDDSAHLVADADKELEIAKRIDPNRPEAYFNQAILTERFKLSDPGSFNKAISLYKEFVERATPHPEFADAIRDVTAVPTKSDVECMKPGASEDPACKKGRITTLLDEIKFASQSRAP